MNSKQVATPDKASDSPLVCRHSGVEEITAAPSDVCVLIEELWNWNLSLCCCVVGHVFCVMSGVLHIDMDIHIWQPTQNSPLLHWAFEDHQSMSTEMEKPFACAIVYPLTKCFGIISVQQICKHCQPVWIGTANLGSSALITMNWWTDMLVFLWKHAWADTPNMSAVMNDSEVQSFIVAVFPECTSLLSVTGGEGRLWWLLIHSCVSCFVLSNWLHTPRAGAETNVFYVYTLGNTF